MHEIVLKNFLCGTISASVLKDDLVGAVVQTSSATSTQFVTPMQEEFVVTRDHLLQLCDEVLEGWLAPEDLEPIAFCLITSDQFQFEDTTPFNERVLNTLYDWDSPEINYLLTRHTVEKFKKRLLTGESTLTKEDLTKIHPDSGRVVTCVSKIP